MVNISTAVRATAPLTVGHQVDLPAEVGDGPGEVVVDILLLVSETPARCLYGRFLHSRVLCVRLISHGLTVNLLCKDTI